MNIMENILGLESSIPANNEKIIEIYNKLRAGYLSVNKDYQRKLVWKKSHKLNFIDTILLNYPFPEVYLAPGHLDQEKLILIDEIVDGQQRLTTIRDYIEGTDVFALNNQQLKKFSELNSEEKNKFLNYEISVRYLKNVTKEQIREIFQRINKTDYALNSTERLNAQWGDSEFVCFAKQLIETEFESDSVQYKIEEELRRNFLEFFHGSDDDEDKVFSENDISRMYALQYIMTLIATMDSGEYFSRNERLRNYIEDYNEGFPQAEELLQRLLKVINFIKTVPVERGSRWFKKANLFSLIIELDKLDLTNLNAIEIGEILNDLDLRVIYNEIGINEEKHKLDADEIRYIGYAREAVNEKVAREFRGSFIQKILESAQKNEA